jgi:hypothetical protein
MLDENQQHPDLFDSLEDDELPNFQSSNKVKKSMGECSE